MFLAFGHENVTENCFLGDPDDKEMEEKQVLCIDNHH